VLHKVPPPQVLLLLLLLLPASPAVVVHLAGTVLACISGRPEPAAAAASLLRLMPAGRTAGLMVAAADCIAQAASVTPAAQQRERDRESKDSKWREIEELSLNKG
jgi:hypothetical protein